MELDREKTTFWLRPAGGAKAERRSARRKACQFVLTERGGKRGLDSRDEKENTRLPQELEGASGKIKGQLQITRKLPSGTGGTAAR